MEQARRIPLGVADAQGRVGVIVLPGPSLEAIDLRSGRVLWRIAEPLIPLLISDARVLVRREDREPYVLAIEIRSLEDGRLLGHAKKIALPHWVDLRDESTSLEAAVAPDGTFVAGWSASRKYRGGAPRQAVSAGDEGGTFRIDPKSASVESTDSSVDAAVPLASVDIDLTPDNVLKARDRETGKELWEKPIRIDDRPRALRP